MPKLPLKIFSSHPELLIAQPNLTEIQTESYKWFKETGLKESLKEVSPIKDYTGKELELYFLDYYFDEPRHDEATAKFKDLTFEAPLRIKLKLVNKKLNTTKEQEVYFGDFPVNDAPRNLHY